MSYSNPSQRQAPSSREIEQAFDAFDDALKLDPDERLRAEGFHRALTTRLKADQVISSAFLQGSFARKTMLKPLRDIDKVMILNQQYSHLLADTRGSVAAANLVEEVLRGYYPNATFSQTRHSIQIDPGPGTFSFDVVPAFEADDGSSNVLIVDLKSEVWERSNTRTLMDVVADRNKSCNGAFIHQVRLVKHWARLVLGGRLPGLHVEAIAFACIDEEFDHANAVSRVFACGSQLLSSSSKYTDPTGVDDLSAKIADVDREAARQAFVVASNQAAQALALDANGDHEAAIVIWKSVFGEIFMANSAGADFLRSLGVGAGATAAAGKAYPKTTPTRAWAPE